MSGQSNPPEDRSKSDSKGEKKLKGCIQSAGGKFVLEEKHGKQVELTGSQDFASHVGYTVKVYGTYGGGADMGSSASTSSAGSNASDQFIVSKIDMVSDTCKGDKSSEKNKDKEKDNSKPSPYHQ